MAITPSLTAVVTRICGYGTASTWARVTLIGAGPVTEVSRVYHDALINGLHPHNKSAIDRQALVGNIFTTG